MYRIDTAPSRNINKTGLTQVDKLVRLIRNNDLISILIINNLSCYLLQRNRVFRLLFAHIEQIRPIFIQIEGIHLKKLGFFLLFYEGGNLR